jgi:hypothetical protein
VRSAAAAAAAPLLFTAGTPLLVNAAALEGASVAYLPITCTAACYPASTSASTVKP